MSTTPDDDEAPMQQAAAAWTVEELPTVFSDLTPIPQDDGPAAVGRIDYPPTFSQAYDYFRAVLSADERSERSLQLTTTCLQLNPANYTVWHFRRLCLEQLQYDGQQDRLQAEMDLAARLGGDNPKNYQIWYHRRALLERLQQAAAADTSKKELLLTFLQRELDYTASVFDADSKNYHSWTYRQWVVQTFDSEEMWKKEMKFTEKLIQRDVRNNSAWNQRWFASHRGGLPPQPLQAANAETEVEYALAGARQDPYNESPWRYLIAVLQEQRKSDTKMADALLSDYLSKVEAVKQVLVDAGKDPESSPNLTSALIDILEYKGDKEALERAVGLTNKLAEEVDPIREKYWKLRCKQLQDSISALTA